LFGAEREEFPCELFMNGFKKLKTVFGHKIIDEAMIVEYSQFCKMTFK